MFKKLHYKVRGLPTPLAGLALGIASLGWCLENALPLAGWGQTTGAVIGLVMIGFLVLRFTAHHDTLWADLKHPVVGSIVPTFAMCLMVVSKTAGHWMPEAGVVLWCAAVLLHLAALGIFVVNRLQEPRLELMVPSWFVPPIGIVVADVTFPEVAVLLPFAKILFWMGAAAYAVLLPLMIYRLFFLPEVPNGAKPTIAILAAPASLLLAGYLTVEKDPSLLLVALLFGIAILMTVVIYFAFWRLLRLQFSPGYAAFTFPMAIGATALYKLSNLVAGFPSALHYAHQIRFLAHVEVTVAAVVILYVAALYAKNLRGMLDSIDFDKDNTYLDKANSLYDEGMKGYGLHLGTVVPISNGDLTVGAYYVDGTGETSKANVEERDFDYMGLAAKYEYRLSKRTSVYLGAGFHKATVDATAKANNEIEQKVGEVYTGLTHAF